MPFRPIVLIPGIGGSKMMFQPNDKSKQKQVAWVDTSLPIPMSAAISAAQHLWGKFNPETGLFQHFENDYGKTEPISGITGCDRILEMKLLKSNIFKNVDFLKYLETIITFLQQTFGYVIDENLYGFTFDFTQSVAHPIIQSAFHALLLQIKQKHNVSPIIISHSIGGLVVKSYMQLHDNWYDSIHHFVALTCPFDGASAYSLQAPIMGYNIRQPIPTIVAKGMQAQSPITLYLIQDPQSRLQTHSRIYVKQYKRSVPERKDEDKMKDCQFSVVLNSEVYNKKIPDVSFLIAEQLILQQYQLQNSEFLKTFQKLILASKYNSIVLKHSNIDIITRVKLRMSKIARMPAAYLMEKDFKLGIPTLDEFENLKAIGWHVYSSWGSQTQKLKEPHSFSQVQKQLNTEAISYGSQMPSLLQIVDYIEQLFETNQITQPLPQKLKRKSGLFVKIKGAIDDENDSENITSYLDNHEERSKSETRQETVEIIQKDDFSLPWISGQIDSKPLFKLLEEAHEIGTLDHFLYAPIEQIYSDTMLNRSKKIDFSKAQQFKFTSISGKNCPTPLHLVYAKPVNNLSELLHQKPSYIWGSGDKTVLLHSALSDGFPSEAVNERYILDQVTHFGILHHPKVRELIKDIVETFGII